MYSPFRGLDEFDVFMDAANRQVAIKLLIDHARESSNRSQYIFITPQTIRGVGGPDVRSHRLQDPERGQQTLNFVPRLSA